MPKNRWCRLIVVVFWLGAGLTGTACAAIQPTPTATPTADPNVALTVYAAASLTEVFTDMGRQFEINNPGVRVHFNFAGSQLLATQINEGAAADVLASASPTAMQNAVDGGRLTTAQVFAYNRLAVILPRDNPGRITTLADLAQPGRALVLAAKAVPAGQYALDFLDHAQLDLHYGPAFKDAVLQNVISYEDNVKQVLAKVALGEADAGIVYSTDIIGPHAAQVQQLTIPDSLNITAQYPLAVLNDSAHRDWANRFVQFVLSPDGQRLLSQYGFIPAITPTNP